MFANSYLPMKSVFKNKYEVSSKLTQVRLSLRLLFFLFFVFFRPTNSAPKDDIKRARHYEKSEEGDGSSPRTFGNFPKSGINYTISFMVLSFFRFLRTSISLFSFEMYNAYSCHFFFFYSKMFIV